MRAPLFPRPDLQGLSSLGAAQGRFLETVLGATSVVRQIVDQSTARRQADELNAAQQQYRDLTTTNVTLLEKNPVSTRDPRYADIPEAERILPNLSTYIHKRDEYIGDLINGIQDPAVRQAFQAWSAERFTSERQSIATWDIGKQHELGFGHFMDNMSTAIEQGDALAVLDIADNHLRAGNITEAQRNEYVGLGFKDVVKRNAFLKAQSMGEAGTDWLLEPANLRYTGADGQVKEMPLADREDLVGRFNIWRDTKLKKAHGAALDEFYAETNDPAALADPKKDRAYWVSYLPKVGRENRGPVQTWIDARERQLREGAAAARALAQDVEYSRMSATMLDWDGTGEQPWKLSDLDDRVGAGRSPSSSATAWRRTTRRSPGNWSRGSAPRPGCSRTATPVLSARTCTPPLTSSKTLGRRLHFGPLTIATTAAKSASNSVMA